MDENISKRTILVTGILLGAWVFISCLHQYLASMRVASQVRVGAAGLAAEIERAGVNGLISGCVGTAVVVAGTLVFLSFVRRRDKAQAEAAQEAQVALIARMSGVLAHELRNPLTSAKGHTQLLVEMLSEGARAQQKAQYVVKELVRLEALTDKLLAFARSGQVKRQAVDPVQLVRTAAARVEGAAAPVVVAAEGAPATWSLDPRAIEQVLVNLMRNAAQAQGEGQAPIEVSVSTREKRLHIAVRDHGSGVPEGIELFTPFVTTKTAGTGLGLALCRQVVRAHGGRISLANHPGGGALAEILLPPGPEPAPEPLRQ
ncbi:MAG TPA: ATP-binding protein [Polyangiaceae bacterium]|nr:ATP-binding protein [Polyangiaceae bacterium]